jgi:BrnA antitoxin of type II toxin-antitoxin system
LDSGNQGEGEPRERRGLPRHHDPEVELKLLEAEKFVDATRLMMRLMPGGWHGFESVPVRPRKTKVTVAFDADMVEWFRRMGAGYQTRMNHVLRVFMLAVQSKEIHTDRDYDWRGRLLTRRR